MVDQQCPTCGRYFKRLAMHKCKGPTLQAPSSASDTGQSQQCPTCGKTFKRISMHRCKAILAAAAPSYPTIATRQEPALQTCHGSGQQFNLLAMQKRKEFEDPALRMKPFYSATDSFDSHQTLHTETCHSCRQQYQRHSHHKCPVGNTPSRPRVDLHGNLRTCQDCGEQYSWMSQHSCMRQMASADSFVSSWVKTGDVMVPCPDCGLMFKRLSMHKCKSGQTTHGSGFQLAPDQTPSSRSFLDDKSSFSSSISGLKNREQECPTCGKSFVCLSLHKCKGRHTSVSTNNEDDIELELALSLSLQEHMQRQSRTPPPSVFDESKPNSREQQCPHCGKSFVRLSMHTCKVEQMSGNGETVSKTDSMPKRREEDCPRCGKTFIHLSMHKCKGIKTSAPGYNEDNANFQYNLGLKMTPPSSSIDDSTPDKRYQECPTCSKMFIRLSTHKCKYRHMSKDERDKDVSSIDTMKKKQQCTNGPTSHSARSSREDTQHQPGIDRSLSRTSSSSVSTGIMSSLDAEAEQLMHTLKFERSSDPRQDLLEFFKSEVKLDQAEKRTVNSAFNKLREMILKELTEETNWVWEHFNSGSAYDGTKVTRADELDCMLIPDIPEQCLKVKIDGAPPGYCFVEFDPSLLQKGNSKLEEFCAKGEKGAMFIGSNVFREYTHNILMKAVKNERKAKVDTSYNRGSPSVPVDLKAIPDGNRLRPVSIDFVPALHLDGMPPGTIQALEGLPKEDKDEILKSGFDVIPKQFNGSCLETSRNLLWRLSFSRAEKRLTKFADLKTKTVMKTPAENYPTGGKNKATCRKEVLRILKRLLEVIKCFDNSKKGWKNPVMMNLHGAAQKLLESRPVEISKFTAFEVANENDDDNDNIR